MPSLSLGERLVHGWNAFRNKEPTPRYNYNTEVSTYRPDRARLSYGNKKTIVASIYNRLALDAASVDVMHARVNDNGSFQEKMNTGLNNCLSISANKDQTARAFFQDVYLSLFDEGCIAIVPVDTTLNPANTMSFDINSLRVAKILRWEPDYVTCRVYNDTNGKFVDQRFPKRTTAIVENPFYAVMNEPSSTVSRLLAKLRLLDIVDEQTSSGKLDLIIQLPYVIRNEGRKNQAESRRKELERQLAESKYGVAYTDGTEKIVQLGHSVDNNLLDQIEYLQKLLYSQLGLTEEIMNGTADEKVMTNYYSRTIEPIISAVTEEMTRKFLSKTAITQNQRIVFIRNQFKLVPVGSMADLVDKFTRATVLSPNEVRSILGFKPVDNPKADQLSNPNLNSSDAELADPVTVDNADNANGDNGASPPGQSKSTGTYKNVSSVPLSMLN